MVNLSEEQELIQKTATDFATTWLRDEYRSFEKAGEVPQEVYAAFHELGLGAIEIPERLGGAGLSSLEKCLILEALAKGDVAATLTLDSIGPALYPLLEMGGAGEDQCHDLGVTVGVIESLPELHYQLGGHGVAFFGTIERQGRNPVFDIVQDQFIHGSLT